LRRKWLQAGNLAAVGCWHFPVDSVNSACTGAGPVPVSLSKNFLAAAGDPQSLGGAILIPERSEGGAYPFGEKAQAVACAWAFFVCLLSLRPL
jgi:hypothetical protein